jgi:hypothetical protein
MQIVFGLVHCAVEKRVVAYSSAKTTQQFFMGDPTEAEYNLRSVTLSQYTNFFGKKFLTVLSLAGEWLVLRWRALDYVGDSNLILNGKLIKHSKQEFARGIAGKRLPGFICAM